MEQLEQDAAQKAAHLMDAVDVVTEGEMTKVHALAPDIANAETAQMKVFQQVQSDSEEQHVDIDAILNDLVSLATDLQGAMKTRQEQVSATVTAMETRMRQSGMLQSDDETEAETKRVTAAINETIDEQNEIHDMIQHDIQAKTREQRTRMGQVFEDMGVKIDMDRVHAMGNLSMGQEQSQRAMLIKAREQMEEAMRAAGSSTNDELLKVYADTKAAIDAVHAMEGLSLAEKKARIAEIKRKAAMETSKIMSRARSALSAQLRSMRSMEAKAKESETLLARAKNLAAGQFHVSSPEMLRAQAQQIKQDIQNLRETHVSPIGGTSFVQLARELAEQVVFDKTADAPDQISAAAVTLRELSQGRTAEDKTWEQELQELGAVLAA